MESPDEELYSCAREPMRLHIQAIGTRRVHLYEGRALSNGGEHGRGRCRRAIICCPGFIQNRYSFSTPGRCLISYLRRRDFDVYTVELHGHHGAARHEVGAQPFEAYVNCDIPAVLNHVSRQYDQIGYIGHSMGGWIGTALEMDALKQIQALVTIATPLYPGAHAFPFRDVLNRAVYRFSNYWSKHRDYFDGAFFSRRFQRGKKIFNSRLSPGFSQIWYPGSMKSSDLDFFLKHSFSPESVHVLASLMELNQTRGARSGNIPYAERLAQFSRPLLVMGGDRDGLAPPHLVEELFDKAGTGEKELRILGGRNLGAHFGHMDLLVGTSAPQHVWEPIVDFFNRHMGD